MFTFVYRIAEVLLVTVVTTVVMYSSGMTVASCLPMKDLNNVTVSSICNLLVRVEPNLFIY